MILLEFGRVKKHTYPLSKVMIAFNRPFKIHKPMQWCFAYKMFKIGFIEIYYFSTE